MHRRGFFYENDYPELVQLLSIATEARKYTEYIFRDHPFFRGFF